MTKNFSYKELACKCGKCGDNPPMNQEFMALIQRIRGLYGRPMTINSAYRCEAHNKAIGSKSDNHTSGYAVDISAKTSGERYEFVKLALNVGINRIGIADTFIHLDTNLNKAPGVIWRY